VAELKLEELYVFIGFVLIQSHIHLPNVKTWFYPDPLYEAFGVKYSNIKDKFGGWKRNHGILRILRFESYNDPNVDRNRKSWKVHRMIKT